MNYVFLGDSPTLETGFARVTKNIVPNLNLPNKYFWGIGYNCEFHDYDFPIYPANINSSWESGENVKRFRDFLLSFKSEITLWTIHDPFRLAKYLEVIKEVKEKRGLRLVSYIPVDSYLNTQEDLDFLNEVDTIVAYTEFGRECILKLLNSNKEVYVMPHGSDPDFKKKDLTKKWYYFPNNIDNKIIGVVNSNDLRKNLFRSLDIFEHLHKLDSSWRMYIHSDPNGYFKLKQIALEKGILDKCIFADPFFNGERHGVNNCEKEELVEIYNCFDLFLSTSHGEGWGLTAIEAASCGVPIAVGKHTSFSEIFNEESAIFLENSQDVYYMGKSVPDFDSQKSAKKIHKEFENSSKKAIEAKRIVEKFDWSEINKKWEILIK